MNMSSLSKIISSKTLFLLLIITSLQHFRVSCYKYQVGNTNGWVVPPSNDSAIYNKWASKNRFIVGDILHFKYERDSVMLVTLEEYKHCSSTRPIFFGNNGNTAYMFDRSGTHYFISGVAGHCEKGQKMIVRVLTESAGYSGSTTTQARVSVLVVVHLLLHIGGFFFF